MVGILSLPFVLALSSSVSPFQKSRGFNSGQIFVNSQCLLKISAGLNFPSFQLNWRYPAAIEPPKANGEQEIGKQNELLTTKFQLEIENRKVEGLITYSTDQQIFKVKVNSGSSQELWGVNTDFTSYELKWTIDAILQHMGFYHTTENPCVNESKSQNKIL